MIVDYEKAYDLMGFEFIYYIMDSLDFSKQIGWTKACMESFIVSW